MSAKTKAKTASPTAPQELATAKVRIDDAGEVSVAIGRSLDEAAGALQAAAAALITPEAVASAEADLAKTQAENTRLKAENAALKRAAAAAADSASTSDDAPYPVTDDDPLGLLARAGWPMTDDEIAAPPLTRGSRSCTARISNQSKVQFTRNQRGELVNQHHPPPQHHELGAIMCVAARTGMRKQMLELIDRGAAVDATGESGIPALGLAAWRGQLACVQALLEKRADLHKVDARG